MPALKVRAHDQVGTGQLPQLPATGAQRVHSSTRETCATRHPEASDSVPLRTVGEAGASVADNWYVNTTQRELTELQADRPLLPPEIDRVLLKDCAQQIGEWKTDIQLVRRALRASFWDRLDELTRPRGRCSPCRRPRMLRPRGGSAAGTSHGPDRSWIERTVRAAPPSARRVKR